MLCKGVGLGLTLDPETGEVVVVLSLHDGDAMSDDASIIVLTPQRAAEVAMSLLARASTGQEMINEIEGTPMDDRPAAIARIVERLHSEKN
jgi:hypothetical protein